MGMKKTLSAILLLSLMTVGCAKKKFVVDDAPVVEATEPTGPYVPPGGSESETPASFWSYGASAPITIEGATDGDKAEKLLAYVGTYRNNPTDITLNLNLVKRGNGYGGRIAIGYYSDTVYHEGVFVNGDANYFWNTGNKEAARYNVWFTIDDNRVFHGFFQDLKGGVIIVIDDFIALGDGQPPTHAKGSIWFKNFTQTVSGSGVDLSPPHPPTHCWFVSTGPFDCRSWKAGDKVNTTRSVEPTNGYIKLGTFDDLNISEAFNGSDIGF